MAAAKSPIVSGMQRNRISILSTRPLDDDLTAMAARNGVRLDVVPFIKTEPHGSGTALQRIQSLSFEPITAVFTSMNAAEAVINDLNGSKPLWKIFCLGNTTRKTIAQYFGNDAIIGTAPNATKLAQSIINIKSIDRVYFFCGDQRRDELPSILNTNQVGVEEIIVYKTIILHNKVHENYQAILFFSPTAVTGFFSNNSIGRETVLFAIGETTAAAIRDRSLNKIVVGNGTSKESLVKTAMEYYQLTGEE